MRLPKRPKTNLQVSAATRAAAKGKYLSLKAWKAVRKSMTTDTGWNTKRYDAWLAGEVSEGNYKVAASHPTAGTAKLREAATATAAGGAKGTMLRKMCKVKTWLENRVCGQYISAPKVRQMEANLTRPGEPRSSTAAAIILTAMDLKMTVEDRRQGSGRCNRDWVEESLTWAKNQGWLQARQQQMKAAMAAAKNTVTSHPKKPETVAIELGSGWEGATRGLRQVFDRVITVDKEKQTISKTTTAMPDYLTEFTKGRHREGGIINWIATKAGTRKQGGELKAIWVSPDCTEETVAQAINKGKKGGKGHFAGIPRSTEAQAALETIVEGLSEACTADSKLQVCIENPAVTALSRERMITDNWGKGETVIGCGYGAPTKKPYRLWMSPATARRFRAVKIDPTSKASLCPLCTAVPRKKHKRAVLPGKHQKTPRAKIPGVYVKAARNMVPERLAKQIAECMLLAYDDCDGS